MAHNKSSMTTFSNFSHLEKGNEMIECLIQETETNTHPPILDVQTRSH